MESNEIDEIYSSISLNREPFFAYLKNLPKVICRLIVKNISVFIRLFYNQYYYIYKILNKTNSYGSDAGDIFHGFETLLKNNPANEKVILNNRDYIAIISQLLEPMLMLIMGIIVGTIIVGLYLPIFDMGSLVE